MDIVKKTKRFISRLYVEYIMSTELYMVEPWERVVMHIIFFIIFALFWYFNYSVVMSAVTQFRPTSTHYMQQVS